MSTRENFKKIKQKEIIKNYYKKKFCKTKQQEKFINTLSKLGKSDIKYKFFNNLSHRATRELKKRNIKRKWTHRELLGCSPDILENHIKSKLQTNMTFDNYGLWEIDHIVPISTIDFKDDKQILECFNFKNLQPLWKDINLQKSNKININYENLESKYSLIKSKLDKELENVDFID